MLRVALGVLLALCAGAAPAAAESADFAFQEHLLRQLSCIADPDPTHVLLYLAKTKRIALDTGDRADSETCWKIEPAIDLRGAAFSAICASAEDPLLIELFPRLYWRGPGTSAGTGLQLVTGMNLETASDWAKRELGNGPYQVAAAYDEEEKTEISCNSLWRN
jgi:hypothetical protein